MTTPRLKPCPFCGGKGTLREPSTKRDESLIGGSWWVFCNTQRCAVMPYTHIYATKHGAIAAWNRRAAKKGGSR